MSDKTRKKDGLIEERPRLKRPELIEADSVGDVKRPQGPDAPKPKPVGPFDGAEPGKKGSGEPTMIPIEGRASQDADMIAGEARQKSADADMIAGEARQKSADADMIAGEARQKSADADMIAGAARQKSADANMVPGGGRKSSDNADMATSAGSRARAAADMVSGQPRVRSAADLQRRGGTPEKSTPDMIASERAPRGSDATMHSQSREPSSGADMVRADRSRKGAEATMHSNAREPRSGADTARMDSGRKGAEATMHSTAREPRAGAELTRAELARRGADATMRNDSRAPRAGADMVRTERTAKGAEATMMQIDRGRRSAAPTMVPLGRTVANPAALFKPAGAETPALDELQAFMAELQKAAESEGLQLKIGKPDTGTEAGSDDLWVEFSKGVRALEVIFPPNELGFDRVVVRDALAPATEPADDGVPEPDPVADAEQAPAVNTGGIAATLARVFGRRASAEVEAEDADEEAPAIPIRSHTVLTSQYRDPVRNQGIVIELVRDEFAGENGNAGRPAPAKLTPQEILRCFLPLLSSLHSAINRET